MEKHLNVPANTEELAELKSGDYVYLTGTIYRAVYLLSRANTSKRRTGHWISRTDNKQQNG